MGAGAFSLRAFQQLRPMGHYAQFPEIIPHPRADYPRVTEPSAESRRLSTHMSKSDSNSGGLRQDQPELEYDAHDIGVIAGFHHIIECRKGEFPSSGFLRSPFCRQQRKWVDHTSQPGRNVASYLSSSGDIICIMTPERWCIYPIPLPPINTFLSPSALLVISFDIALCKDC